jgi:hypothetical protein
MNRATTVVSITITIIIIVAIATILLAKGYRVDINKKSLTSTSILVATSDPDGAEVIIDGKLKTATNNTIDLEPKQYTIRLEKEGYAPWEKIIDLKPGEVYKTNAFLFPKVPDLRPLTFTGAINPSISASGTKIVYSVASTSAEKVGIWTADISRSAILNPLGSPADHRQLTIGFNGLNPDEIKFLWSPDSTQLIAYTEKTITTQTKVGNKKTTTTETVLEKAFLIETDRLNSFDKEITNTYSVTKSDWNKLKSIEHETLMAKLPTNLSTLISSTSANISFSPDQTKILYVATQSAEIAQISKTYLPGSNPTKETRKLVPGKTYVYDTKEDKNYEINNCDLISCQWFPSSRHLLTFNDKEIAVMEYDGTNRSVIYSGPFSQGVVYPWPNWSKIVILTSLNATGGINQNLYTINLR